MFFQDWLLMSFQQHVGQNPKLSKLVPQPSASIFVSHYPNSRTWIPSTYWTLGEAPVISSSELPDCHGQPTFSSTWLQYKAKLLTFSPQVASKRNYDNQRAFARGLELSFFHFFFLQTSLNYVLLLKWETTSLVAPHYVSTYDVVVWYHSICIIG